MNEFEKNYTAMIDDTKEDKNILSREDEILPTREEFLEELRRHRMTTLGNMFPILKKERARILCCASNYFLIGFIYAFLRLYKDKVIYNFLEPSAVNWLKPINTLVSFVAVSFIQRLLNKHGVNKGVSRSILGMATFMFIVCLLMSIKNIPYLQPNPLFAKELFIGKTAELRGLGFLKCPTLIINNWIMSLFYVISEVFGSALMSYLYCTYMSYNTVGEQNGRFLKMLYIGASFSLLLSGQIYPMITQGVLERLSYNHTQDAYVVVFICTALMLVLVVAIMQFNNRLFAVPLFSDLRKRKTTIKKKVGTSLSDGLSMAFQSNLLMAMCTITLGYNFSNAVNSAVEKETYSAVSQFYSQNKTLIPSGKICESADVIASIYQGAENTVVSVCIFIMMITPAFHNLFTRYGIALFGAVSISVSSLAAISSAFFSLRNYSSTNNGLKPLFGEQFSIESSNPNLFNEAFAISLFNGLLKISKYGFFDVIKEAVSMKIEPSHRSVFKSVFDGVFGKLGKSVGSGYCLIVCSITGKDDARYYAPLTAFVVLFTCLCWAVAVYYLHFNHKKSIETDSYMDFGFSKQYSLNNF